MKKIFILYLLFSIVFLQAQQISNRFAEAEQEEVSVSSTMDTVPGPPQRDCPPEVEDCDPLPVTIDDYIPLLLITATGLMLLNQKRKDSRLIIRKF